MSDDLQFGTPPARLFPQPKVIARKCIVCGTTKHEHAMKPFLLRGEQLNTWTNCFFSTKRHRVASFYSKLRYTINPFACVDHFTNMQPPPKPKPKRVPLLPRGKKSSPSLLAGGDPPSLDKITSKKPSPPPEAPKPQRSEKEVNEAVMAILMQAREQLDQEAETKKILKIIGRTVVGKHAVSDDPERPGPSAVKRKRKRKREPKKNRVTEDGNEADSDNSEIDIETVESDEGETMTGSSEESEGEKEENEVIPVGVPRLAGPPTTYAPIPPLRPVLLNRRPQRPYLISAPPVFRRVIGFPRLVEPAKHNTVPRRLTINSPIGKPYHRPSWVSPNPGQRALSSVLEKFWNEDLSARPNSSSTVSRPMPFGKTILPGTKTKFVAASLANSKLIKQPPSSTKVHVHHPSIRNTALIHNPPLSPSRLIIGSEETVMTTVESGEGEDSCEEELARLLRSSSSSSASSSCSDESEIVVCDPGDVAPKPPGPKIEGMVETSRCRSVSTYHPSSDEEQEKEKEQQQEQKGKEEEASSDSSTDENAEVDVETIDETPENKVASVVEKVAEKVTAEGAARLRENRRKQKMPPPEINAAKMNNRETGQRINCVVPPFLPPSATIKPPVKLLSSGQYSVKDLLQAQSRLAAVQPIRISSGIVNRTRISVRHSLFKRALLQMKKPSYPQKRQPSEWSRLEKVVERRQAERRAQLAQEKKKKAEDLIDHKLIAENPPPVLDRVDNGTENEATIAGILRDKKNPALLLALTEGIPARRSKFLRMRFHKKDDKDDVITMKVLDRSTCPLGVGREEEVEGCPSLVSYPIESEESKGWKYLLKRKLEKKVSNPLLVIDKTKVMEMHKKLNVPPPTPIIGIPGKEQIAARREMYDKKRLVTSMQANLKYGSLRSEREEWLNKKMMGLNEAFKRRLEKNGENEDEDEEDEEKLVMEAMEVVKLAKAEKMKESAENTKKYEEALKSLKEPDIIEDATMVMLSDIDDDDEKNEEDVKEECEETEDIEERRRNDDDEDWTMTEGVAEKYKRKKMDKEGESETRRKSHRLKEKRAAMPKSQRTLIWKTSEDEDSEEPATVSAAVVDAVKRKRGRPRKSTDAPPPKKKRREKGLTEAEKKVLARLLTPLNGGHKGTSEIVKPLLEEEKMEMDSNGMEQKEDEADPDDAMAQLEMQPPKPEGDAPMPAASRRKMLWSWKQRLGSNFTANNEMGGRLCNFCMKLQKRYYWVPNEAIALMDHARMHCVETLMCPNEDCTYMNTQRSRIAQHVSYVHKKWGLPIDVSAVYPSMRKSLEMRMRQCFPDLPNLAVCQLCRVASRPDRDNLIAHAYTHLDTMMFECSRDICTIKYATEQECIDHIQRANCHGSVMNGITEEMEDEIAQLATKCFGNKKFPQPTKNMEQVEATENGSEGDAPLNTSSTPAPKPLIQPKDDELKEEEEETPGPSH